MDNNLARFEETVNESVDEFVRFGPSRPRGGAALATASGPRAPVDISPGDGNALHVRARGRRSPLHRRRVRGGWRRGIADTIFVLLDLASRCRSAVPLVSDSLTILVTGGAASSAPPSCASSSRAAAASSTSTS
jgi:hypothetical protein